MKIMTSIAVFTQHLEDVKANDFTCTFTCF